MNLGDRMINITDLKHYYKDADGKEVKALDSVSLHINPGEFVAIIGANGSGKSTLARHLNALLVPTEGKCEVDGMDTLDDDKLWDIRQTVGMVFQNPDNQIVAAVVEEDVAFGPENLGIEPTEIRKRVDEALETVGMTEYMKGSPNQLSGGQKQRIAIAGVIAMQPRCIVFDESTAMLDPIGRRQVMTTMEKLNKEHGITIVHITHYMQEAIKADRIIVMDKGKVIHQGTPREVFKEVKMLKEIGLDVPDTTYLAYLLHEAGFDISTENLTIDEVTEAIWELRSSN